MPVPECRGAVSPPRSPRRCGWCRPRPLPVLRVSGVRAVPSAADRDSKVGVGPSCAAPMPSSATRAAQRGWSTIWGTTTWGAPARAAVVVVPAPPWCTTAASRGNSACWLTSPTAKQSSRSSVRARSAQPRARSTRRPCARLASMATRAMSFGACAAMLPKPTYTGGVPASRNASSSAGSGRSSGRIHAPVCTRSRSVMPFDGHRVASAASHGRPVKTWSRTLSTGGRPIAARWRFSASPYSAFTLCASCSHSTRLSVSSRGDGVPGRAAGGKCRDGSPRVWKQANT